MLYKTHAAGGFAAGLILTGDLLSGLIALVFALLPDIESPDSFIGRKIPVVSHGNKMIFGHRQVFHSLVGALAFFLISLLIIKSFHLPAQYAYAALIGYVSHLVLDSFNSAGVPWLWPLKFRVKIPLTEPGGFIERVIILPAVTMLAFVVLGKYMLPLLREGVSFL
jgi:inner membrane protein